MKPTRIEGYDVGKAQLSFSTSKGVIVVENARLSVEGAQVSGTGRIEPMKENAPYNFDLKVLLEDPEAIGELLGDELSVESISAAIAVRLSRLIAGSSIPVPTAISFRYERPLPHGSCRTKEA